MNETRGMKAVRGAVLAALCILVFAVQATAQETEAVSGDTLVAAAKAIMEETRFCVLITLDESGHPRARAMDPFMPDENMTIWMGTGPESRKVSEIRKDPRVALYYDHTMKAGYVVVYGTAELVDDPALKEKWFKEEWGRFYADRETGYILIAVKPEKIEVLDYTKDIIGDPETWIPPSVSF